MSTYYTLVNVYMVKCMSVNVYILCCTFACLHGEMYTCEFVHVTVYL